MNDCHSDPSSMSQSSAGGKGLVRAEAPGIVLELLMFKEGGIFRNSSARTNSECELVNPSKSDNILEWSGVGTAGELLVM